MVREKALNFRTGRSCLAERETIPHCGILNHALEKRTLLRLFKSGETLLYGFHYSFVTT